MHLPDGFLDARTSVLCTGAAATGVGIALREVRQSVSPRQMPLLGLGAAFVFAAQMLNFPVAGGTSGHLVGGVLMAVLLGPSAAVLVMTCVLMVQCLMFADGGLTALGANVFNMGILNVCAGYCIFRLARRCMRGDQDRATVFAAAFAAWCGTVLAAIGCAGELALSRTVAWSVAFPAMADVHMLIGIGEGLATGLVVMSVLRSRPQLVVGAQAKESTTGVGFIGYGLLLAFGLAVFVAPFACRWPDGLEAVARQLGFDGRAAAPVLESPFANYQVPFFGSGTVATAVAGLVGTILAFIAAYMLARVLVPVLSASKKNAAPGN